MYPDRLTETGVLRIFKLRPNSTTILVRAIDCLLLGLIAGFHPVLSDRTFIHRTAPAGSGEMIPWERLRSH